MIFRSDLVQLIFIIDVANCFLITSLLIFNEEFLLFHVEVEG